MLSTYIHNNPRVFAAFLIGSALVGGAYVISNFGVQPATNPINTTTRIATLPERPFIPVVDADSNGIEDWREEFVLRESIILPVALEDTSYEPPTTLTGRVSEQFFESILRNRISGIGPSESELVTRTVETVTRLATADGMYNTDSITVVPATSATIKAYANQLGASITRNDIRDGYENEICIMQRALQTENEAELQRLLPHTSMYRTLRDEALAIPVPQPFIKQHLDLVNTYHALYKNLSDMQLAFVDPMLSLARVKRYQDDSLGLGNALSAVYTALIPHANLFTPADPALVLVAFAPRVQ
jgi:hypothetical protein